MLFDGLSPIVCGVLGYVSIILYDLNNTSHNNDRMQSLHTVGAGLIGLAFFNPVLPGLSEANPLPTAVRVNASTIHEPTPPMPTTATLQAASRCTVPTPYNRSMPANRSRRISFIVAF